MRRPSMTDWIEYVALRLLVSLLLALPWHTGRALAAALGDLAGMLDRKKRKKNTLQNLRNAFPQLTERQRRKIMRGVYRHLFQMVIDTLQFKKLAVNGGLKDLISTMGFERVLDAQRKTGVIFVTGHFGWWELLGSAGQMLGLPVWSVARQRSNPLIDDYIITQREGSGQRILRKKGVMRQIIRKLRRGEHVAFLIDQDARRGGTFVDFFARPASTETSPARLALYTGAPVAFVYATKEPRTLQFRAVLKDMVWPHPEAEREQEIFRITQRLTKNLECIIRENPSLWLWLHRRWKTYPGKYPDMPPARFCG